MLFQCVQYIDESTFAALLPKLQELLRSSVALGTRVAAAHFIVLVSHHLTVEQFQPYVGELWNIRGIQVTYLGEGWIFPAHTLPDVQGHKKAVLTN